MVVTQRDLQDNNAGSYQWPSLCRHLTPLQAPHATPKTAA